MAGLCSVMSEASARGLEGGGLESSAGSFLHRSVCGGECWLLAESQAGAVSWSPCVWPLGFHIKRWLAPREGAPRESSYHCLRLSFGTHTVSLPPHSIGKVVSELCPGRRTDAPLDRGVLMSHCETSMWDGMRVGVAIFGKYYPPVR